MVHTVAIGPIGTIGTDQPLRLPSGCERFWRCVVPEDDKGEHDSTGSWFTWPPSPKTQIILFLIGLGLFNLLLIAIWAIVLYVSR